jgi:uncharacterized protein
MDPQTVYEFDWDPAKASSNLHGHGIAFDQAATVFLDPLALTVYDASSSQGEDRWFTLGCDRNGRLLAVAHTYLETEIGRAKVRIISARRATRRERRSYEEDPQ